MRKYLKMAGFILLYLAVYLVVQLIVGSVIGIVYVIMDSIKNHGNVSESALTEFLGQYTPILIIVSVLVAFPFYYLITYLRKQNLFKVCEFSRISLKNMGLTAVLGAALSIFSAGLLSLIPVKEVFPGYEEIIEALVGGDNFILVLIATGIMAPVFEEIIFRGLIFYELRRHTPVAVAVTIQALLFGIYHGNPLQAIYASILGALFAMVYLWTKSIWASILMHAFLNTTSTVMSRVLTEEFLTNYSIIIFIASFIVFILSFILLLSGRRKTRLPVQETASL